MSSGVLDTSLTVRTFLLGDSPDTVLGRKLTEQGVARSSLGGLRRLSAAALHTVDNEIGAVASGLLELDLGDVLLAGWRKYSALTDAARRTLAAPGSEEVLELATHRITSVYLPHVDLFVDDQKIATIEFDLTMVFDVTGLAAVVKAGDLIALQGGECMLTATLSLEKARLAQHHENLDLARKVRLSPPISLIDKAPTAPATELGNGPDRPRGAYDEPLTSAVETPVDTT